MEIPKIEIGYFQLGSMEYEKLRRKEMKSKVLEPRRKIVVEK